MSRSIFRCFSSCFRFALAAMAAAPTEEAGRAGSRRRCRGPALPPTGRPGRRRLRPLPSRAPVSASARLCPAGQGAEAAQHAPTGHTNRPGGTTATAAAATFPTSPKGERRGGGGGGAARGDPPRAAGSQVQAGALCWPGGVTAATLRQGSELGGVGKTQW